MNNFLLFLKIITVLLVVSVPIIAVAQAMSLSDDFVYKSSRPIGLPSIGGTALNEIMPMGFGPVTIRGDKINLKIMFPEFDQDADVYLFIVNEKDAVFFNIYGIEESFRIRYTNAGGIEKHYDDYYMIMPWKKLKRGERLNELVFSKTYASLEAGANDFYVAIGPTDDINKLYIWEVTIVGGSNAYNQQFSSPQVEIVYPKEGSAIKGKFDIAGHIAAASVGFGPNTSEVPLIELFVDEKLIDWKINPKVGKESFFNLNSELLSYGEKIIKLRVWDYNGDFADKKVTIIKGDDESFTAQSKEYLKECCSVEINGKKVPMYWKNLPNKLIATSIFNNPSFMSAITSARNLDIDVFGIPSRILETAERVDPTVGVNGNIVHQIAENPDYRYGALAYINLTDNIIESCVIEYMDQNSLEENPWLIFHEDTHCKGVWDLPDNNFMNTEIPNHFVDPILAGAVWQRVYEFEKVVPDATGITIGTKIKSQGPELGKRKTIIFAD